MRRSFTDILLLAALVAGCDAQSVATAPDPGAAVLAQPLPLVGGSGDGAARDTTQTRSSYSGFAVRRRIIVRDAATWQTGWHQFVGSVTPKPEAPTIDFSTKMVLIATMGSRSSGGYSISIDRVSMNGDAMLAVVREVSPGRRCIVTAAFSAPATAVVVPVTTGDVSFRETTETRNC
jgi:hypothetical protein